jgi:riboflavin synthase
LFTGIITHIGRVEAVRDGAGSRDLVVAAPGLPLGEVAIGASVAHSGVCLTVVEKGEGRFRVQASPETLARTTVGRWREGEPVNLERSLRLGDELGGHLVFGHVDAVGEIAALEPAGEGSWRLEVRMPEELAPLVAVKGSVAVDGISLTVNEAGRDRFACMIVPHTWDRTTLRHRRPGDPVNLEADMLARYVARQAAFARG